MAHSSWTIQDYLADESFVSFCFEADPTAIAYWEQVQQETPSLIPTIQKAKQACLQLTAMPTSQERQDDFEKLQQQLQDIQQETRGKVIPLFGGRLLSAKRIWTGVAAIVALVAGTYWFMNEHKTADKPEVFAKVYSTGFNERKDIQLPDGTTVTLNAFSQLKVVEGYNKDKRCIYLDGEAFFDVWHDAAKPFVVYASNTATTVLGTSFKIRNYSADKSCMIMLSTGKVSVVTTVKGKQTEETLLPGNEIVATENDFKKIDFDSNTISNWKNKRLVFREADEKEIAARLNDIYGVHIIIDPKHAKPILFTGEFNGKDVAEVLDAIGFTNSFTHTVSGNDVRIVFDK